jgi:hypothetical protein
MGNTVRKLAVIAVAVFAPYIVAWAASGAAAFAVGTFANTALSFVLSSVLGSVLAPKQGGGGAGKVQDSGFLVNKNSNTAAIPIIYGSRRIGGTRVFLESTDASGNTSGDEYLHIVLAVAQGGVRGDGTDAVSDITRIIFNDRTAWTSTGGIDSYYSGNLTVRVWLGKNDQTTASPDYTSGSFARASEWDSSHRMRGVAYVYVICKYDRDKFPGAPTILVDVAGKRIQSVASLGTWVDTAAEIQNPANIVYDYLTSERYGKGLDATDIDLASFQAARTWANTAGITINGGVDTADTIFNNLQALLAGGNLNLVYSNGKYQILPIKEEDFTGAFTFDESNILGKWQISLGNKRGRFNQLKVNYFDPDIDWQPNSLIVENATYLSEDSGVINEKTIELPYASDTTLATKMGTYFLNLSRYQTQVNFKASHEALKLQVGDPVYITHEVPNWTNEKFRVNSVTLMADSTVDITLEQYAPDSIYLENN